MMKTRPLFLLRAISLLALLIAFVPVPSAGALPQAVTLPAADLFQLPWDQGLAWVAIDGLDNGLKRPLSSSHNYTVGGAVDFAPHNNMRKGENTSNYWVTAAAAGTVIEKSFCHIKINHGNGWTSEYQFLANVRVKVGDAVFRNQRLGIIADGISQPFCPGSQEINVPHLHFMLRPTLRDVTFAGWTVNYLPILNRTTFTKNGQTVGLYQPLLNSMDTTQIVLRGPITWDTTYTGSLDSFRYERWSLDLTEPHKFTLTVTPDTNGLVPLTLLLDANGNELARGTDTLTSTQPAGNYFVQIQPQVGNGFYSLIAQKSDEPLPSGPYSSTVVTPGSITVGETAVATVSLNNVPVEGFSSAEFTCTYDASRAEVSNISIASLFGPDPVAAINGPQNGSFIVAIAGSNNSKATTSGTTFTFSLTGLSAGQVAIDCKARVSKGDNLLTELPFVGANLVVLEGPSTPTPTPGVSPVPSAITEFPGATPTPSFTPSPAPMTPTISPTTCDQAEFTDLDVPPGTVIPLGSTFTKNWLLRNVGFCTWTPSYQLVFFSGDQMGAPASINFPYDVAPGQLIVMSIPFSAPATSGHYTSLWKLRNASGTVFGIGPSANDPLVVDINVSDATATSSPTPIGTAPSFTPTPTPATNNWLTFTNLKYSFQFKYPPESQLLAGNTDNYARINLPRVPGTNLGDKYLEVIVAENANPCQSPLATELMLKTSETVMINGISFLKQTGEDGSAGHINKWTAYSTSRDNICVSLDFVLRAANPGNFATPPPLYDEAAESVVFGQIVSTYEWLPTATPTSLTQVDTATPTSLTPVDTATPTLTSTPVESPTPTALPDGSLTGQVLAGKPVTVSLYGAGNTLVTSVSANPDGTFSLTAPAGAYNVVATASGFLSAQGSATITGDGTDTKPRVTLLAGDIDGNNVIDQFDALTIGMNYNGTSPSAADLNNDGVINVLDLEALAGNYRATGPIAWEISSL